MSFKSGFVSLVGRPNVGKSTILNAFVKEKVAITSGKPQTTRNVIRGILTDQDSQIIFMDTPGIHKPKSKLGEYMVHSAYEKMGGVDLVLMVIDPSRPKRIDEDAEIISRLKEGKTPVVLLINKVDLVSREALLPIMAQYSKQMDFKAIVPISAIKSDNLDAAITEIKSLLKEGPKYFPDEDYTDQPEKVLVSEMVREKVLKNLDEEVPHGIGVEITSFKEREGHEMVDIEATIYCEKDTHKAILIGKKGSMLKKIGTEARRDIESLLQTKVYITFWVKVKQDWRNSQFMLKNLGYTKKN
jgi:GTPase